LKNKGAFVPFHHQYLLAQMVKGIIVGGSESKFGDYANYNFSGLKGQTKISRSGLHFYSNKVTLVFSAFEGDFIDYFLKQLFGFPQIELGNLILIPEYVEQELLPKFEDSSKFICISPLVLLEPTFNDVQGKRFISPETDEFSDLLYETTMARLESSGRFKPDEISQFFKFQVLPDVKYLAKITASQKKFARIYPLFHQDVKYEVRGYTLPFTLFADPRVQEFAFILGLGLFGNKGFGMLDVAQADPSREHPRYDFET